MGRFGIAGPGGRNTPERPSMPRARRSLILVALALGAFLVITPKNLDVTLADTLGGYSTNGSCITAGVPVLLWSQSAVGISDIAIKFRLDITHETDYPGVVQAGWTLSSGAQWQSGWWTTAYGTGTYMQVQTFYPGSGIYTGTAGDQGTAVGLAQGTTGILKYYAVVNGYGPGACMTISNVVVTRHYYAAPGTGAPGGGGFVNPTPTPTTGPTNPAMPTEIPGATPGPGVICYTDINNVNHCLPATPPSGWCYVPIAYAIITVQCGQATSPPATPDPNSCAGMAHYYCSQVSGTNSQTVDFANVTWNGPDTMSLGGWLAYTCSGTCTGSPNWRLQNKASVSGSCRLNGGGWGYPKAGTSTDGPWGGGNVANLTANAGNEGNPTFFGSTVGTQYLNWDSSTPGTRKRTTSYDITVSSGSGRNWDTGVGTSCSNSSTGRTFTPQVNVGSSGGTVTWTAILFIDKAAPGGAPDPTPTPTPTLPPNYNGPGNATAPPQGAGGGGDTVDICATNPTITACAHSFPPGGGGADICATYPGIAACATAQPGVTYVPDPSGAQSGVEQQWQAIASALAGKAPFGYIDQVGDALTGAVADAHGDDSAWTIDMPVWAPDEAGGTYHDVITIPRAVEGMDAFRSILLAILTIIVAVGILRWAQRATGSAGSGDD